MAVVLCLFGARRVFRHYIATICFAALLFASLVSAQRTAYLTPATFPGCDIDVVLGVGDYNGDDRADLVGITVARFGNDLSTDSLTYWSDSHQGENIVVCTALGAAGNFTSELLSASLLAASPMSQVNVLAFRDFDGDGDYDLLLEYYNAASPSNYGSSGSTTFDADYIYALYSFIAGEWVVVSQTGRIETTVQPGSGSEYDTYERSLTIVCDEAQSYPNLPEEVWPERDDYIFARVIIDDFNRTGHLGVVVMISSRTSHHYSSDYNKELTRGDTYAILYPSLNMTLVNFTNGDPSWMYEVHHMATLDVDADGWVDLVNLWGTGERNYQVDWIHNNQGVFDMSINILEVCFNDDTYCTVGPYGLGVFPNYESVVVGDFNADGIRDIGLGIGPNFDIHPYDYKDKPHAGHSQYPDLTIEIDQPTVDAYQFGNLIYLPGLGASPYFHPANWKLVPNCPVRPYLVADVTGDGLDDVVGLTGLWLANNGTDGELSCNGMHRVLHPYPAVLGDYNGDGTVDVLGVHSVMNNGPCPVGTAAQLLDSPAPLGMQLLQKHDKIWGVTLTAYPSCSPCVAGVATSPDHLVCGSCPPGSFPARPDTCRRCGSGQFSADGLVCAKCDADHVATVGKDHCDVCPPGSIPDPQSAYCVLCSSGTRYDNGELPSRCTPCGEGEISPAGALNCTACASGQAPTADKTECFTCPLGQGYSGGQCVPCAPGMAGFGGLCQTCATGSAPSADRTRCDVCPSGTIATTTACTPCAGNAASLAGAGSCKVCVAGQGPNADRSDCVACPAGSYSTDGVCVSCPVGTQSSSSGATSCDACADCGLAAAFALPQTMRSESRSQYINPLPALGNPTYVDRIQNALLYVALATFLICAIGSALLTMWVHSQPRPPTKGCVSDLASLDMFFAASHRVPIVPGPVIKRRTIAGAFLTVAVSAVFIFLIAGLGLRYALDNQMMIESQLPNHLRTLRLGPLPPVNLVATITLYGYGGPCTDVLTAVVGMRPITIASALDTTTRACALQISCSGCTFDASEPRIVVTYAEASAYAQSLAWNISASTDSVPGANWVAGTLVAPPLHVIQGVDPPTNIVAATFYQVTNGTDVSHNTAATADGVLDEYVVGMVGAVLGSTANATGMSPLNSPGIQVTVTIQRESYYVQLLVVARQSFAAFATSVFGLISGVLVLAKFLLAIAENMRVACLPTKAELAAERVRAEAKANEGEIFTDVPPGTSSSYVLFDDSRN